MPHYFLVHDEPLFRDRLRPALAAAWRQRSFAPCQALCAELLPRAAAFAAAYHTGDLLLSQVAEGLAFDRDCWRYLVGEMLLVGAVAVPEIQTTPEALMQLVADGPGRALMRQVHFGTHELTFGGAFYRPDRAGYNTAADVRRLSDFLATLEPAGWTAADLAGLPDADGAEDLADELAFVQEWLPALQELYRDAAGHGHMIVCEVS